MGTKLYNKDIGSGVILYRTNHFCRIIIISCLIVVVNVILVRASLAQQTSKLKMQTVEVNGVIPSFSGNRNIDLKQGSAYDARHQDIYLLYDDLLWRYSIQNNTWSFLESLSIDKDINYLAYDSLHNRLLMWDRGVGRVYEWTTKGKVKRIDHSFEQKNQFGHLAWLDPSTDNIYAFGGYGLFSYKNFITYFSQSAQEWLLLKLPKSEIRPSPQTQASGVYNANKRILWMIGSASVARSGHILTSKPVNRKALWSFNVNTRHWQRVYILPENISTDTKGLDYSNKLYPTYIRALHLAIFPLIRENNIGNHVIKKQFLAAYDTQHNVFSKLPLQKSYLPDHFTLINLFWVKNKKTLYVLGWRYLSDQQLEESVIYRIPLQHLSVIKSNLTDHSFGKPSITSFVPPKHSPFNINGILILVIGFFTGGLISYFYFRKHRYTEMVTDSPKTFPGNYKNYSTTHKKNIRQSQSRKITIISDKPPQIFLDNQKIEIDFTDKSEQLLQLLIKRTLDGKPHILTDEVDQIIWPDYNNLDYVRKLRNKTIEYLESIFQQIMPLENDDHYICRRNYIHDQRKIEYYLNPDYLTIITR